MAGQEKQSVSKIQVQKKDPFRGIDITIQGYTGIMNTQPPDMIPDNATQSITNFLPIGNGIVRKIQAPALYCSLPNTPIKMINDILNGNLVMFVILSDGSAGTITNGIYTQIAPSATFSTTSTQISIANWQNQFFLIADATKGYFAFYPNYAPTIATWTANTAYAVGQIVKNGNYYYYCIAGGTSGSTAPNWPTTAGNTVQDNTVTWQCFTLSNGLLTINPTLPANQVIVYQGRVFLSLNRTITYSAPLSFIDFTTTDGGGYLVISSSDLKSQITKLVAYMNNIYVVGDHAVIAITGTTITADPSQWYIMEIFNTTGTIYPNSVINFNNVIYLVNEYGVWQIASSQAQKVDYTVNINNFQFSNGYCDIGMINNLNFYLLPIMGTSPAYNNYYNYVLAYCIDLQQYFYLDFGFNVQGIYVTRSITDHSVYILANNAIYKFGAGTTPLVANITTKSFDFGNNFFLKTFRKVGMNIRSYAGTPTFNLTANLTQITGTNSSITINPIFSINTLNQLYELIAPQFPNTLVYLTQNGTSVFELFNQSYVFNIVQPVFLLNQGGVNITLVFSENSNAVFDIIQTYIVGNLGGSIM